MNRTIERSYRALDFIADSKNGLTLKELTELLEIPKSSTFNIIQTLVELGLANENNKRYTLGVEAYCLGMRYLSKINFIDICKKYLDPLADKLHRNSFVGILDNDKVLYVHKHVGEGAKLATCDIGTKNELYCTGLGKSLLAFGEEKEVDKILEKIEFVKKTDKTITNIQDLKEELTKTRMRGYGTDDREIEEYMLCFSAPIFNQSGQCIAAISISDMYDASTDYDYNGQLIKDCALSISKELGYEPK